MSKAEKPENLEKVLEIFREKTRAIHEEELKSKKTAHFVDPAEKTFEFVPGDLTVDDMMIWRKIEDGTITRDDIRVYGGLFEKVHGVLKSELPDIPRSRQIFRRLVNNKATSIIVGRELDEREKSKK